MISVEEANPRITQRIWRSTGPSFSVSYFSMLSGMEQQRFNPILNRSGILTLMIPLTPQTLVLFSLYNLNQCELRAQAVRKFWRF
jgi:hypothetical protein